MEYKGTIFYNCIVHRLDNFVDLPVSVAFAYQ